MSQDRGAAERWAGHHAETAGTSPGSAGAAGGPAGGTHGDEIAVHVPCTRSGGVCSRAGGHSGPCDAKRAADPSTPCSKHPGVCPRPDGHVGKCRLSGAADAAPAEDGAVEGNWSSQLDALALTLETPSGGAVSPRGAKRPRAPLPFGWDLPAVRRRHVSTSSISFGRLLREPRRSVTSLI